MLNIYVYIHLYNITFPVDWTLEYTLSVIFASIGKHEYTPSGVYLPQQLTILQIQEFVPKSDCYTQEREDEHHSR